MMETSSFLCALAVKLIQMMDEPKDGESRAYTFTFEATRNGKGVRIDEPTLMWKAETTGGGDLQKFTSPKETTNG